MGKGKKRILVILATPFYLDKGSSVRARSNIIALTSLKEVDLICYPLGEDKEIKNLKIIRCPIPFYKKISAGPSLSKFYADFVLFFFSFFYLCKNSQKYSLVVGEDFEGGFIALLLGKIFKKTFLYEMYNPLNETLKPYTQNRLILKIAQNFDNFLEKHSQNISTEWDYEKERVMSKYPHKNVLSVYDAFPTYIKKPEGFEEANYICYTGNFKNYQGIPFFLDCFQEFLKSNKKINLVLVGDRFKEMEEYSRKLKIDKKTFFLGRLSLIETNYIIKKSLFCILPRVIDGPPGMKALHYYSQEKCILATDLTCNSKLIRNLQTGLLVENNKPEMVRGIERLVTDDNFRKQLEENILREKIGIQERTNEQMKKIFDNLNGRKRN